MGKNTPIGSSCWRDVVAGFTMLNIWEWYIVFDKCYTMTLFLSFARTSMTDHIGGIEYQNAADFMEWARFEEREMIRVNTCMKNDTTSQQV